jgi:predicted O-methyltransferase YrrM
MKYFQWIRIKDYLHYYLLKPHKHNRSINNAFIRDFINNVISIPDNPQLKKIKEIIESYLKDNTVIEIEDLGAGSKGSKNKYRKISEIAKTSGSSNRKSRFLYNVACYYSPDKIVELGTSLGIGTISLALANEKSMVYTLEGSPELHRIASENFQKNHIFNIQPICGEFEKTLSALLDELKDIDLFFIDGNHTYDATLKYYELAIKHAKPGSILIFDDIRWSAGMYSAWQDICGKKESNLTIDLLDIGIVFVSDVIKKQYFRIYY